MMIRYPDNIINECVRNDHALLDGTFSYAIYSSCVKYRYILHRTWDENKPPLIMIMLNPSTATELANDPTVERCQQRSISYGLGGIIVLNLYAFRATEPRDMLSQTDPVGKYNDAFMDLILDQNQAQNNVICGWGNSGSHLNRHEIVLKKLEDRGIEPLAFKWNKGGFPGHPLYLSYSQGPKPRQSIDSK